MKMINVSMNHKDHVLMNHNDHVLMNHNDHVLMNHNDQCFNDNDIAINLEKIEDQVKIMEYGIMSTPGVIKLTTRAKRWQQYSS
jgi:hypothetical protein